MSNVDITRYGKRIAQLFWDPGPKINSNNKSPIWCLGRQYDGGNGAESDCISMVAVGTQERFESVVAEGVQARSQPIRVDSRSSSFEQVDRANGFDTPSKVDDSGWPQEFLDDFEARIWLTYRSNFPAIPKVDAPQATVGMSLSSKLRYQMTGQSGFTSDTGWGCMIRSGQSLLANALILHRLGRERRRNSHQIEEKQLLSLFADDPRAPFSIHRFVEHGASACGTYPGQWFGPSATAKCIQALSKNSSQFGLRVYVTGDGPDIYEDALMKVAKSDGSFFPTLVLVGTRLGIDRVTPVYWDALKSSLQMPQSVGIAGGRPSSSHYFVGTQGDDFFYLDPHHTRTALPFYADAERYTTDDLESCHTRHLRTLDVREMDPSMLIGFLFEDEKDWQSWRHTVSEAPGKAIFHIADSEPLSYGRGSERDSALDEVQTFDDETDDGCAREE